MAKKVNKNIVAALTAVGFVATTAIGVLMIKSLQKSDPKHWVEIAEQAAAAEDWEQAKLNYYRAFQVSKDPKYLVDVGSMLYEAGNEIQAFITWNNAVTQDPFLVQAHDKIIDLRIEFAEMAKQPAGWIRLKEAADAMLKVEAQNPKGLFARGYALTRLRPDDGGNMRHGIEDIRRAVEIAPEVIQYSLRLAAYYLGDNRAEEAERILKRLIDQNTEPGEDAARVRFTYARFLGAVKRHDEAIAMFDQARLFAGDDPKVQAQVKSEFAQYWTGRWYRKTHDPDTPEDVKEYFQNAKRLLEESIALNEDAFVPYMLLSELFSYRGDHLQAIATCTRRINRSISRQGLKATMRKNARYLLLLKAAEECLAHVNTLDRDAPERNEMLDQAERFCKDAAMEVPQSGLGLHTMGKVKLAQGDELAAIQYFQLAEKSPGTPDWRNSLLLAQLLLRQGQSGAALTAIRPALENKDADAACWLVAAQAALATGDAPAALRHADEVLRRSGMNRGALRFKVEALRRLGRTELADAIAADLAKDNPDDLALQANLLLSRGKTEEALDLMRRVLDTSPDNVSVLRNAVNILAKQGRHDEALALVNNGLAASPDNFELAFLATSVDKSLTPEQRDRKQLEILKGIDDPIRRTYQLMLWYGGHALKDEYAGAMREFERLLTAPDTHIDRVAHRRYLRDLTERQFLFATSIGDTDEIERVVNLAVKTNADGADGLIYRGRAQMAANKPELALASFKAAIQKQPTNAKALTYIGQCHMALDPPQTFEARTYFERAVAADPNQGMAQKGLAALARVRGDVAEYESRLAICARLMPDDTWIQAQLLAKREESSPEEGIQRRLRIREREPENVENLLALARLYALQKRTDEAAECYDAALKTPDVAQASVIAASRFFRKIGDGDRALQIVEQFIERAETDEQKANSVLLLADHWYALGESAKAEAALQRAAALRETLEVCAAYAKFKTDVGDFLAAAEWYDRAVDITDKTAPELSVHFRRNKIDTLFRAREHEAARREIDAFIAKYPDDPTGFLMRSAIDTVSGNIDDAVANLDRYLEERPDDLTAVLQRARLAFTQGRYAVAIRDLEQLRSINPKFQNFSARMLLADGYALTQKSGLAYEELESIIRDNPEATDVAVHLIVLYGEHERFTDAIRVCTSMANRYPDSPIWVKNRGDIKAKVGNARSSLADYELAAKLSGYQPHYTAALLKAYARFDRLDDGINYYTQTIPSDLRTPRVVLRYGELLARAGRKAEAATQFLTAFRDAGYADLRLVNDLVNAVIESCGGEQAIDLFRKRPENPTLTRAARHVLALLLDHYNRDSEALTEMKRLLEDADEVAEKTLLLGGIGNLYERQQNWDQTLATYEQLIKVDDRSLVGLNNIAFLLSDKLDRPREALAYAERASLLYPNKSVRDTLGWTHVLMREYRKAIGVLTETLKQDARYVPAIYHLAEAYRREGDLKEAVNLLEGAVSIMDEGVYENYRDKVRKALNDARHGETAP